MDIISVLEVVENSGIYLAALVYFAWCPIFSSIMWIFTALVYFFRRERGPLGEFYNLDEYPFVTVLIPAYNEGKNIEQILENTCRLDYPNYEIVVIDDASNDSTNDVVMKFVRDGRVRLISK